MTETPTDTCSLEELYKVEDMRDISKCFAKIHANIAAEFGQFRRKLKETTDRVVELEKARSHFETEQLEMKESTIPAIIEEVEKHNTALCDELLALNLWGMKWNLIVHGITGELNEFPTFQDEKFKNFSTLCLRWILLMWKISISLPATEFEEAATCPRRR